jgi:hypothetical protein
MDKRQFLKAFSAVAACTLVPARETYAYVQCQQTMTGQACEVGVARARLPTFYAFQELPQWCWAASVSMIFKYYGYEVSQQQIVEAVYGATVNLPALAGAMISQQLNREWVDARGRRFRSTMQGLFDADAGVLTLNNQEIVQALASERPFLLGNTTHAVVLTAVGYFATPMGPNIFNIGVLDPWPGIGMRGAQSPAELVPMPYGGALRYLALPLVQPA